MTVLLLDNANFGHRCRAGMTNEGNTFTYKYLRSLRALVAELKPTSLVLVKEGSPEHRYELFPEYKGNRRVKADDPEAEKKFAELMTLQEQLTDAVNFCVKNLEVTVLKHPCLEADDLIANVARSLAKNGKDCVIASNDKDFQQLLSADPHIRLYDLGKKEYVTAPGYNVLIYKALLGDKSDNVPGVPGFGPKKAEKAALDPLFDPATMLSPDSLNTYERNLKLLEFRILDAVPIHKGWRAIQIDRGKFDPAACLIDFMMLDMPSMAETKAYDRFCETFGSLKAAVL